MKEIEIIKLTEARADYLEKINKLLCQLTADARIDINALKEITASDNSHLFILFYEGNMAGMLSIGHYRTPTGIKYWIEDVVIDKSFRGKSLGKALIQHAIAFAGKNSNATLMLTSKPERVSANNLYRTIGFQQKQTNVYKMTFNEEGQK